MREAYGGMEDVRGTDDPEAELEAVVDVRHGCNCTVANLNRPLPFDCADKCASRHDLSTLEKCIVYELLLSY